MEHNTRRVTSTQFNSYHSPPGDLPVSEAPRDSRYQNIAAPASQTATPPILPIELGTQFETFDGRVFKFVLNSGSGALAEGELVTFDTPIDTDTLSSSTDLYEVTNPGASMTINQYRGFYLTINDGTGEGQTRRIAGNDATTFFLEEPLTVALAVADSDGLVWHPYSVEKTATGITVPVTGVSIGTIAAAQYGWIQCYGLCEQCFVEVPKAQNGFLSNSSATAGYAEEVGSGETLDDAAVFGTAMVALANNDKKTPVFLWGCVG